MSELDHADHHAEAPGPDDGAGLAERLDRIIGDAAGRGQVCALVFIALDDVEVVGTLIGTQTAADLMAKARWQLSVTLDSRDTIEPWGETGFAIVMRDCNAMGLFEACRRYRNVIRDHNFIVEGREMTLSVAVGAVLLPGGARTGVVALANATTALNQARGDRSRSIAIYKRDTEADRRRSEQRRMVNTVVAQLARERIRLSYQPVVCAVSGRTAFHEALVRIADEAGALRPASTFIGATERLGLVPMVDNCVLDLALEQLRASPDAVLSLNVSHATMVDGAWMAALCRACISDPGIAGRLLVEIGSPAVTAHFGDCAAFAAGLRGLGVQVVLDDFGSGPTLLGELGDLGCDVIKIDAGLGRILSAALVTIARESGARTVMKGVDRPETGTAARQWGVDYLQGYATGLPVAVAHWPARNIIRLADKQASIG